jgi:hypothetical protein
LAREPDFQIESEAEEIYIPERFVDEKDDLQRRESAQDVGKYVKYTKADGKWL